MLNRACYARSSPKRDDLWWPKRGDKIITFCSFRVPQPVPGPQRVEGALGRYVLDVHMDRQLVNAASEARHGEP